MAMKSTISLSVVILAGVALLVTLFLLLGAQGAGQVALQTALAEAPERLHPFLTDPESPPRPEAVVQLQPADLSLLLQWYKAASDLSARRALVWALGSLGGKEVVDLFLYALTTEFQNHTLSRLQEDTLADTTRVLGLLAQRDAEAYTFLKRASDPAYWKAQRRWRSPRGGYADSLLTSHSIQAVALSGRPDAMAFLQSLKAQPRRYLHAFAGDVAQGAFYLHLRQTGGQRLLLQYMLTPGDKTLFQEWIKTAEGARWLEWANEQMRGPVPTE